MKLKWIVYLFLFFLFKVLPAQNKQILYDFDEIPQTLMLNPGAVVSYDKHFGVPLLSNLNFQFGATNKNMTYKNILAESDGIADILSNVYKYNLSDKDIFKLDQRIEIINAGLRLKNPKYYLSFGIYEQIDGYASYPKDLADFFYNGDYDEKGNIRFDSKTNFSNINFTGSLTGIFHIGISNQITKKLNVGVRLKLISGSFNINTSNNSGNYYLGNKSNPVKHMFDLNHIVFNTSGFIRPDGTNLLKGLSDYIKGMFFMDGNIGMGVDLGFTYNASDNIIVSGSLLDLDYISFTNEVTTYEANKFTLVNDDYFKPIEGDEINYWENIFDDGDYEGLTEIPIDTLQNGYNINRSPKLNTSVKYRIFRKNRNKNKSVFRNTRYVKPYQKLYKTEFGIQTYTELKPDRFVWAVSPFILHDFNQYLTAKLTYTYDAYSPTNIGFGLSTHYKIFNLFATADNLLNLFNIENSNYQSFQFGMNFVF